jgi:carboxymethylenebutenolidase
MQSDDDGFAKAAQALLAQVITTDTWGLVAGEVSIAVGDSQIPGYRAMPAGPGTSPVVLVVQEIFGVHEHIRDVCRRLAKLGYFAIAPDLYARQGDVSTMSDIPEIFSSVVLHVPDAQVCADLDAALAFAQASGHADAERVGLVGFCWGGRVAWVYASHNPKLKAAVSYYGLLEGMKSQIRPNDPLDLAESLRVPVLGLYAGHDDYVQPAAIDQMRAGLVNSGSGSQIVVFPNVNHGFNADYRPTYDQTAATYAWKLAHDWLRERGV